MHTFLILFPKIRIITKTGTIVHLLHPAKVHNSLGKVLLDGTFFDVFCVRDKINDSICVMQLKFNYNISNNRTNQTIIYIKGFYSPHESPREADRSSELNSFLRFLFYLLYSLYRFGIFSLSMLKFKKIIAFYYKFGMLGNLYLIIFVDFYGI